MLDIGCGDGAICPPEECDPPASRGGTASCSDACRVAVCGNGIVDRPQEECDDGTSTCRSAGPSNGKECGTCAGKQACDADGGTCGPGNSDTRPGACRTNCKKAFCGDGVVDDGTTTPSSLTVIAHHDEENTTTTTVRGSTTTSRTSRRTRPSTSSALNKPRQFKPKLFPCCSRAGMSWASPKPGQARPRPSRFRPSRKLTPTTGLSRS